MLKTKLNSLSIKYLREIAKINNIKKCSSLKKNELIDLLLKKLPNENNLNDIKVTKNNNENKNMSKNNTKTTANIKVKSAIKDKEKNQPIYTKFYDLDTGITVKGIIEIFNDGYGFIRSNHFLSGKNDIYVSPSLIKKFKLKTGDFISGNTRIKTQNEKFSALLYLKTLNGVPVDKLTPRVNFENLTPIFPNKRIKLSNNNNLASMKLIDLFSPIGKGQRGMIVSPPKAGKTTLLKQIALSAKQNDPDMHFIILLIDERPEEVTDIKECIQGDNIEIAYSTFDELPEHHEKISEMVIERAKRLVENKLDVMILIDSITRLTRAYNTTIPQSGRTLSGGLDSAALHMPKKFFGSARNFKEGGSLTIISTALIETGSRMDDVVYEEFKGTGNMELILNRDLQEKGIFPAINITKSGTRREDLLYSKEEFKHIPAARKYFKEYPYENLIKLLKTYDLDSLLFAIKK